MTITPHDLRTPIAALRLTLEDLTFWPETTPHVADQLRRANTELDRLAGAIEELLVDRSVAHFAGMISHDLRQPLTAMLANAEMLVEEPAVLADPESAHLANASFSAGGRLAQMIDVVDAFARAENGPQLVEVSLGDLVGEIRAELAPQLAQRKAAVEFADLPTVRADRHLLRVALHSLISRSLKLPSRDADPVIVVTAAGTDSAWTITLSDNSQPTPAVGLGWRAADCIAEAHHGRLAIEEALTGNTGNTVTLQIARYRL